MFHVELRQFPHVSRAFNLERVQLDERFAKPWVSGAAIDYDDRRWSAERAKIRIFEGPALATEELGMGRGWATVAKTAQEVTETVLAQAERGAQGRQTVELFKLRIQDAAAYAPIAPADVVAMVGAEHPGWRASEQVALAEQAVWELLHQGGVTISDDAGEVASERWQQVITSWATWSGDGAVTLDRRRSGLGDHAGDHPLALRV